MRQNVHSHSWELYCKVFQDCFKSVSQLKKRSMADSASLRAVLSLWLTVPAYERCSDYGWQCRLTSCVQLMADSAGLKAVLSFKLSAPGISQFVWKKCFKYLSQIWTSIVVLFFALYNRMNGVYTVDSLFYAIQPFSIKSFPQEHKIKNAKLLSKCHVAMFQKICEILKFMRCTCFSKSYSDINSLHVIRNLQ